MSEPQPARFYTCTTASVTYVIDRTYNHKVIATYDHCSHGRLNSQQLATTRAATLNHQHE